MLYILGKQIEGEPQFRFTNSFKPADKLKIIPSFQSVFDLYQNEAKTQTTQTFGLSITSTIDNVRVGGRYKGILRSSLGDER